ncbi:hypothetical protein GGX14DRAFT_343547 [Mycena pura]|uniref:Fido domain-containing protein n=1 Tax=Mycena pura TaxID=153505 RepID=A0AAD6YW05_9AGAR|nr:hypothetical protein GGX14DRAFT_343547 [Mycena pura]
MAAHVPRLARLFTPEYVRRINSQIVFPQQSLVVKPHELESALARPLHQATYTPDSTPALLAATLSFGLIQGHAFLDGNKRTAFFVSNEYLRAMGIPGLADDGRLGEVYSDVIKLADDHIGVASGRVDVAGLAAEYRQK